MNLNIISIIILTVIFIILALNKDKIFSFLNKIKPQIDKLSTPNLDRYSRDLTKLARENKLDPVIDRDEEIKRLIYVLSRRTKNNPVLIGQTGVGKTAIVEGLAIEIAGGRVPKILADKRVLALDLNSLLAGTKYRGEFESRLKNVTDEIIKAHRSIILFIDELHIIARAGEAEGTTLGAADILKPALARGELQMVGATTPKEYIQNIREDETLERRFHPIMVDEPNMKESIEMLKGVKAKYEDYHKVKITDEALKEAVDLAAKYIKHRFLPDKAIDLIDEACAKASLEASDKTKSNVIPQLTAIDIKETFKGWRLLNENFQ